jgi:aspartyl-tRNA(Asn)/glutamyl-tRNA(Gln) amidotransferase subunit C
VKFDINYIADLARLQLTAAEKRRLGPQLRSILSYVEKISELKTDNVPPTFQMTGLKDVVRKDKVSSKRSLSQGEALSNAPDKKDGFFKVKRILEF